MAVKVRLKKTGTTNKPSFRIVVIDGRCQRDGRTIETLGFYNPVSKEKSVNVEKIDYWISKGAKMSPTVAALYKKAGGKYAEKKGKTSVPKPKKKVEAPKDAPKS